MRGIFLTHFISARADKHFVNSIMFKLEIVFYLSHIIWRITIWSVFFNFWHLRRNEYWSMFLMTRQAHLSFSRRRAAGWSLRQNSETCFYLFLAELDVMMYHVCNLVEFYFLLISFLPLFRTSNTVGICWCCALFMSWCYYIGFILLEIEF